MKIIALADIHGDVEKIDLIAEPLMGADLVLLAGDITNPRTIGRMAEVWLATDFEAGRHQRRLSQIESLERPGCPADEVDGDASA